MMQTCFSAIVMLAAFCSYATALQCPSCTSVGGLNIDCKTKPETATTTPCTGSCVTQTFQITGKLLNADYSMHTVTRMCSPAKHTMDCVALTDQVNLDKYKPAFLSDAKVSGKTCYCNTDNCGPVIPHINGASGMVSSSILLLSLLAAYFMWF